MDNLFMAAIEEIDAYLENIGLVPEGGHNEIRSITINDTSTNVTDMNGYRETKLNLFDDSLADKVEDLWERLAAVLGHTKDTEWGEPGKFLHVEGGHLVFISVDGDVSMVRNPEADF